MWARSSAVALLLALACALGCEKDEDSGTPEPTPQPNIVLITIDTLRADRLGCYGFAQARTPNIDRLASEGVLVEHAIAATPMTLPSHASIFTGLHPPAHRVRANGSYKLSPHAETLAELMSAAGYRTQAFVSAAVLHHRFNLDQGFDGYDDRLRGEKDPGMFRIQERTGRRTVDQVVRWLDDGIGTSKSRRPFFLWVHLFDPHQPYEPPEVDAKASPTPYDGEIASADRQVGRLISKLEDRGVLDDTVVLLTSDHGESLGEHGEATHAIFVYESTVRVPLILRYPRKLPAGVTYRASVAAVDLMPTLIGLAGMEQIPTQGSDLSKALAGTEDPPVTYPYSESLHPELEFGMAPLQAMRSKRWTYVRAPRPELYDRARDPHETQNLLASANGKVSAAAQARATELDARIAAVAKDSERFGLTASASPLDAKTVEMLQALGYMRESDVPSGVEDMDPKDGIEVFHQMDRGRQLALRGDYEAAKKVLLSLLKRAPKNASARNLVAMCELRTGNTAAAERQYRKSLQQEPAQPQVLVQLGRIALAEERREEARSHLRNALSVDPSYVDAMLLMAYLDLQEGRMDAAKRWYQDAVDADSGDPDVHLQYGDFYFRQREFGAAKRWYEKALALDEDNFIGALQAGTSALRLADLDTAARYFRRASEIDPASWKPWYNLACAQRHQGRADAALRSLMETVRRGLPDPRLLNQDPCFAPLRADPRFQQLAGTR